MQAATHVLRRQEGNRDALYLPLVQQGTEGLVTGVHAVGLGVTSLSLLWSGSSQKVTKKEKITAWAAAFFPGADAGRHFQDLQQLSGDRPEAWRAAKDGGKPVTVVLSARAFRELCIYRKADSTVSRILADAAAELPSSWSLQLTPHMQV